MTNKEIYEIMNKLGMIEEDGRKLCNGDELTEPRTNSEIFEEDIATDLVATMKFIDELCMYNDLDTIKKFLVALIYTNKE